MNKNVILAGGGRHSLSLGSLLEEAGLNILGYTDLHPRDMKWKYLGTDHEIVPGELPDNTFIVVAVGTDTHIREALFRYYTDLKLPFLTFVHSQSYVSGSAKLGEGCILYPHSFVGANVRLERNVHLCCGAIVEHESSIGQHSYLAPGAVVAGRVSAGSGCMLGINSTVMESIHLADRTTLGAASFLLRSVDLPGQTYVGVPAVSSTK